MIRRSVVFALTACLFSGPVAAQVRASAPPVVPVTVRVFDGESFVGDLKLDDFELLEGGLATKPRALYVLRKNRVERREGDPSLGPDLSRHILLVFHLTEYSSRIAEAIGELFEHGIIPGDTLELETPIGHYGLSPERLATKSRAVLAGELVDIVRKDIIRANMGYNSLVRDIRRIVRQISGGGRAGMGDTEGEVEDGTSLEQLLMGYAENLQQFERLRALNEQALLRYAQGLKDRPGLRTVYYFYQREYRPEIDGPTTNRLLLSNQDRPDIQASVQTLFGLYNRDIFIDHERLWRVFADAGATFNFLYVNKTPERIPGINLREQSEDVFKALIRAASATGGVSLPIQNPAASMRSALAANDACYLLFFTPAVAAPPGTFLDIEIKVKRGTPRVVYRAGYFTGPPSLVGEGRPARGY